MKISIYTLILPRLEVFFLGEWIEHHLMLGVDKIYIYDNGFIPPTKQSLSKKGENFKWRKKPDADYFEDYSDEEIMEHLHEIVNKFDGKVEFQSWIYGKDHKFIYPISQAEGYFHCIRNNMSDWWIHIDPDEYLFSEKYDTIKEFVHINEEQKRYALNLTQRVFKSRSREKKVREVYEWGYDIDVFKTIVKSPKMRKTPFGVAIHRLKSKDGPSFKVESSDFRFNHYRGIPNGDRAGHAKHMNKHNISSFDNIDRGMEKFL